MRSAFLLGFLLPVLHAQQAPIPAAKQLLKEMVEFDTTGEHGDTTPLVEALARRFREAGVPAADIAVIGPTARHENLVVRLRGRGQAKPILVLSHLDVVEAKRSDWSKEPFKLTEENGWYYGRGTQDIKGEAAAETAVFLQMAKEGFKPKGDLILALTTGEEGATFYNGVEWLLRNWRPLIDADYCLNGDGGGLFGANGKPLYRSLQTAEKGFYMLDLEVTDPGGHSSLPRPGNPIQVLGAALGKLEGFKLPVHLDESRRAFFERMGRVQGTSQGMAMRALAQDPSGPASRMLESDPWMNALMRTTVVATRLQGGHADNALPQSAKAALNVRLLPGDDVMEVVKALEALFADPRVKVSLRGEPKPNLASPLRPDLVDAVERTTARLWPGLPTIPIMDTGASDGAYLRAAGIPTYGISAILVDKDDVRAHGRDERIRKIDFEKGVEAFDLLIRELVK